jgi:alginate O-acetyltransferase complex protein AlgI
VNFTEVEAAFFLPAALLIHWLLPRRAVVQNLFLLLCSCVFYAAWDWRWLPLLWAGAAIDFTVARYMESNRGEDRLLRRRAALGVSLAWNLGALAYFKYANFFIGSAADLLRLFGLAPSWPVLRLILPLGLSFYTLQRIGYVADVYLGRDTACRSPLQFALFSGYFPQITAGPIARASELLPQLAASRRLRAENVARGGGEFLLGYMLKAWIADTLGTQIVGPVFGSPGEWTVAMHWLALVGYALQVFGDFAGYSLIAIGCSRLFGIELPVNFNHPFLSRSLPELWRRWHISLNRWLFDYIYGPLTTSRSWFRGRFDAALLLTFLASGLWHGAAMTFVVWGLIHGFGMIVQRHWDEGYRRWCRKDARFVAWRKSALYSVAAWLSTQLVFVLALVPFNSPSLPAAARFAAGMLGSAGSRSLDLWWVDIGNLLLGVGVIVAYHLTGTRWGSRLWQRFVSLPAAVRGVAYGAVIVFLALLVPIGVGTFIYQQF